jgi:uncharacterized protein
VNEHLTLAGSLALVVAGYVLARRVEKRELLRAGLDGLVLVTVSGLAVLFILPHAFGALGAWAVGLCALGFLVPTVAERLLHRHEGEGPWPIPALALVALAVHCGLDGAVLAEGAEHAGHSHGQEEGALAATFAILLHRLPVGLFLGSTVRALLGPRWALGGVIVVLVATLGGNFLHGVIEPFAEGAGAAVLNALLAGGLLHVVLGHGADSPTHLPGARRSAALGAVFGLGLIGLAPLELPAGMRAAAIAAGHLFLESSPAVLAGFFAAGLLSLISQERLAKLMTGSNVISSAARGVIFGLPIPICSCGVVPLYRGLMKRGVPPAAAIAFLIATPELGFDSILLSFPLLGWQVAVIRFLTAVVLAIVAGSFVGWLTRGDTADASALDTEGAAPVCGEPGDPCAPASGEVSACDAGDSCEEGQSTDPGSEEAESGRGAKVWTGFRDSLDELGPWILAGLAVAGVAYPLLDPAWVASVPPLAQVPLFSLIGAPIYLCASSATPLASVLLTKGVAAGAVIAFLLTGPATNITTYGAIRLFHGRTKTLLALGALLLTSILLGFGINQLPLPRPQTLAETGHVPSPLEISAGLLFGGFLLFSLFRQGPRGFLQRLGIAHTHPEHDHRDLKGAGHDHAEHDHAGHDHDHAGHDHDHAGHDHDHAGQADQIETPCEQGSKPDADGGCCG